MHMKNSFQMPNTVHYSTLNCRQNFVKMKGIMKRIMLYPRIEGTFYTRCFRPKSRGKDAY